MFPTPKVNQQFCELQNLGVFSTEVRVSRGAYSYLKITLIENIRFYNNNRQVIIFFLLRVNADTVQLKSVNYFSHLFEKKSATILKWKCNMKQLHLGSSPVIVSEANQDTKHEIPFAKNLTTTFLRATFTSDLTPQQPLPFYVKTSPFLIIPNSYTPSATVVFTSGLPLNKFSRFILKSLLLRSSLTVRIHSNGSLTQ